MGSDSLWIECSNCSKKISTSAKSCPHCGARRSRFGFAKWLGGGVLAILILASIAGRDEPSKTKIAQSQQPVINTSKTLILPEQQSRFLNLTKEYGERFASLSNELQQSLLRDERRSALVNTLGSQRSIVEWRGKITKLETNSEGKAILTVRLSENTSIGTWNNALSDIMDGTLIEKGTPLYMTMLTMSVGDNVSVSGIFLPSNEDGIKETSLTLRGSMSEPDFLFKFSDISMQEGN